MNNDNSETSRFIEQAEYLPPDDFLAFSISHPREEEIVRKLISGGAKLLVGPRGCGKTTLMLKAFNEMLRNKSDSTLPIYVNFKLSLKLEPLYQTTANASFWFRSWLVLKIFEALHDVLIKLGHPEATMFLPGLDEITMSLIAIESGDPSALDESVDFEINELIEQVHLILTRLALKRCVLLLDDAAHAFSPKQQEDFFDFFRQLRGQRIATKAAIYPGITSLSPNFHIGHDAEKIDVWIRPDDERYEEFMRGVAQQRFGGQLPESLANDKLAQSFLAFASFGIPRSLLNMLRFLENDLEKSGTSLDRRKLLDAVKISRDNSHAVYDALVFKLPTYRKFIETGDEIYSKLIESLKEFNRNRTGKSHGIEIGLKRPFPPELSKLVGFFQYAGLIMESGENSRGIKGVFDIYFIHFADLITENAVVGLRTKSIERFVEAFKSSRHQAWPRVSAEKLIQTKDYATAFPLSLPSCRQCGEPRGSENAKFCSNCGAELQSASIYHSLVNQDISVLPITRDRARNIKKNCNISTIKDLLMDATNEELRSVPQIGPKWAERIFRYAEEYVA